MSKSRKSRERDAKRLAETLAKQRQRRATMRPKPDGGLKSYGFSLADPTACLESLRRIGGGKLTVENDGIAADGDECPLKKGKHFGLTIPSHMRPTYASELLKVSLVYSFGQMFNRTHSDFIGEDAVRQLAGEMDNITAFDFSQEVVIHYVANQPGEALEATLVHLRNGRETRAPLAISYATTDGGSWKGTVGILKHGIQLGGRKVVTIDLLCWMLLHRNAGYRYVHSRPAELKPSVATVDGVSVAGPSPVQRIIYVNRQILIRPQYAGPHEPSGRTMPPHDRHYRKMEYERVWTDKTGQIRRVICHRHKMVAEVNGGAKAGRPKPINVVRLANPIFPVVQ